MKSSCDISEVVTPTSRIDALVPQALSKGYGLISRFSEDIDIPHRAAG